MTDTTLAAFTMRTSPPKTGEEWFSIVAKKGEPTKVYIYDEIGMWGTSAKDFAAQLDDIDSNEIHLHLNSPGGSVFDGLAIHASLKNHPAKVTAYVDGLAASAASFILQAADERVATRNCQVMIHDAKAFAGGNAQQMRKAAELLDKTSDNIADMYAQRGTEDAAAFRTRMKAEEWYTGQEAADLGLVDSVSDADEEDAADAKNATDKWDLKSVFHYAGRDDAPPPAALLNQLSITPEEAPSMTGTTVDQNKITPPPVTQPTAVSFGPGVTADNFAAAYAELAPFFTNGALDYGKLNAHVLTLTTFKKETVENSRKNFVKALAEGPAPKIAATQIEAMEKFALGLSPEQYSDWKASYDAAPSPSMLQTHGSTPTQEQAPQNGGTVKVSAEAQRMSVLEEIIASHRDGGMTEDEIKNTKSFKDLEALRATVAAQAAASAA